MKEIEDYIIKEKSGYMSTLYEKFSKDKIDKIDAMGWIIQGFSKDDPTWHISRRAERIIKELNRKPTFLERIKSFICIHIFHINFSNGIF